MITNADVAVVLDVAVESAVAVVIVERTMSRAIEIWDAERQTKMSIAYRSCWCLCAIESMTVRDVRRRSR